MKINLCISSDMLGNDNQRNRRYATAVADEIKAMYRKATVNVEIVSRLACTTCYVSNDYWGDVAKHVNEIAKYIQDYEKY